MQEKASALGMAAKITEKQQVITFATIF